MIIGSGGVTFLKVGGGGASARHENYGIFFMKRFTLTVDPMLIVLKPILRNLKCRSGVQAPLREKSSGA